MSARILHKKFETILYIKKNNQKSSTVASSVLASILPRVDSQRQLLGKDLQEFPADSRLDFHVGGCRAREGRGHLDSGTMRADIWCRATSFHRESERALGETNETSCMRK